MISAVINRYHYSPHEAVSMIKRKPDILDEAPELWKAGELLQEIDLTVIPVSFFPDALMYARRYNLLITDAVHVAAMKKGGITHIATNDSDFARIPWL